MSARWSLDGVALGLGLLLAVLLVANLQTAENISGDSARYLGLADALRTEGRYTFDSRPHTRFPPGFPLLLAGLQEALGDGYQVTLRAVALQGVLALWAGYGLLRAAGQPGLGVLSMVLLASSPYFFERASRTIAPEFAYMVASFVALLLLQRLARDAARHPAAASVGLAASVLAAISLRSVGVALLLPLAAGLIGPGRHRWTFRAAVFGPALVAGAGFELAWLRWQRAHRAEAWPGDFMYSYSAQVVLRDPHAPELGRAGFADLVQRVGENLASQASAFSELVTHLPFVGDFWYSPLVVLPVALGTVGMWHRLTSNAAPWLELYMLAYLCVVLVWPFDEGPRYMLAVFPLALLYVVEGALRLWTRAATVPERALRAGGVASAGILAVALAECAWRAPAAGRQALASLVFWSLASVPSVLPLARLLRGRPPASLVRGAVALAVGAGVLCGGVQMATLARQNRSGGPEALRHPETLDAAAWLAATAAPDDAIMAGQEAVVHYLTGRHGIPFPVTSDAEVLRGVLRAQRVRYWVVLEYEPYPYFRPTERARLELLEAAYPDLTRVVHRGSNYRIVAVEPEPASLERR